MNRFAVVSVLLASFILPLECIALTWRPQTVTDALTGKTATEYVTLLASESRPGQSNEVRFFCHKREIGVAVIFDSYFSASTHDWIWASKGKILGRASAVSSRAGKLSILIYERDASRFLTALATGNEVRLQIVPNYFGEVETLVLDPGNAAEYVVKVRAECSRK